MNEEFRTVRGLQNLLEQTTEYKNKRPTIKPVFIDKCNWLINSIVDGNKHAKDVADFGEVPLNKTVIRKQLGNVESKSIIALLEELKVIRVNRSYLSASYANKINSHHKSKGEVVKQLKPEAMKYALTTEAKESGLVPAPILSDKFKTKYFKYKLDILKGYLLDNRVHSKILSNLPKLYFNEDKARPYLEEVLCSGITEEKALYYKSCFTTLRTYNQFTEIEQFIKSTPFYYTQSYVGDRVYHYYTTIPRYFRQCMSFQDKSPLSEIDLKNSQPLMIALEYQSSVNEVNGKLLEDVLNGKLYLNVAMQAKRSNDHTTYNLFTDHYSKFKALVLGQGLYYNYLPLESIKPAEKYLIELYPDFMDYVRYRKRTEGYKTLAIQAQKMESSIFINELFGSLNDELFAIPVHDSLIVKRAEVSIFHEKLIDIVCKKFPFLHSDQVRPLFTVTDY